MPPAPLRQPSDDDEDDYRVQVARYPRLSNDDVARCLAERGPARDAANRTLIEHNLYLVFDAAMTRKDRGVPCGDRFQEGTVGRMAADEN